MLALASAAGDQKGKKEKEVLLHNLKNILGIIEQKAAKSTEKLEAARADYRRVQGQFDECMLKEKEHFQRVRQFEEACDRNDELREKLGM